MFVVVLRVVSALDLDSLKNNKPRANEGCDICSLVPMIQAEGKETERKRDIESSPAFFVVLRTTFCKSLKHDGDI